MTELQIFTLVLPVIALIAVGWVAVRLKILAASDAKPLTTCFLYIFLPALLIAHLAKQNVRALLDVPFIAATAALMLGIYGTLLLIQRFVLKRPLDVSALAAFAGSKFNAVVVGLPLLVAALGKDAITPVLVNLILGYFTILPLTLVLLEVEKAKRAEKEAKLSGSILRAIRHTAVDPLVVATVLGITLSATGAVLPGWVSETLSTLGAAAIPVPLVAVGMTIRLSGFKKHTGEIVWMSAVRSIASPLAAIGVAKAFSLSPVLSIALVISFGLPTAKMAFALAEEYGDYVETLAGIVTLTTTATVLTYPALVWACERIWPGVIAAHAG
jgi:predicted permease